jgi:segregation and condensation protein A
VSFPLNFHLDQYDGPLDLLLDLIRSQKIDIRDIPIASLTAQYLEYLDHARERDIDIGADFIFMAATLIHIKSRMLLPTDPALAAPGTEEEDPRTELVNRLIEHEKYRNAAQMLQQKRMIEENVWSHPRMAEFTSEDDDPGLDVNLFDLIKAFGQVLERAKLRPVYEVNAEEITVADMVLHLKSLLSESRKDKPLFILQILEKQRTRRAMICLFLAVLEMVKRQAVEIVQQDLFGEIALVRSAGFDEAFAAEESVSLEEEYK